jgi:pimeloyl-ACP methyl ester carboxylesterase
MAVIFECAEQRVRERVLRLADGRTLAYVERGDPAGTPILEFHGLPNARHADTVSTAYLRDRSIHRITVDRPGVGFSDHQPGRELLDWPRDVAHLVDALGIERFALLGVSGGGPYALACAWALPERVAAVALVSGIGPLDRPGAFEGMNRAAARVMILARRAPWLARLVVGFVVAVDRVRPGTVLRGLLKALPEPDQKVASGVEVRESLLESYALAFRQGTVGQVRDWAILATPWGFRPEDVQVPVQIFHGKIDDRVPVHHAEHLARVIPDSQLTLYAGEGHMIIFERAEEFLGALTPGALHMDRNTTGNGAKRSMK